MDFKMNVLQRCEKYDSGGDTEEEKREFRQRVKKELYNNGCESEEVAEEFKRILRRDLLRQMCYWAAHPFTLDSHSKEFCYIEVDVIGAIPSAFVPSVFEKREFRDIINDNLELIYEENRGRDVPPKKVALNLLAKYYWR